MSWVRRQGMHLKPYRCVACGQSATPPANTEGEVADAYFCEGVDVNWGDSVFLCEACVWVLGQLAGVLDPDQVNDLKRDKARTEDELEDLKVEHDATEKRIARMLDGSRAMKEARKAAPKKKVNA